ncbi:MAG: sugar ABC transporter permease [Clostridiales Family XIII bacterium]|jgi:raffinose/stachyose/melibiose transport system permease protein|nr:sugar ABC transporter permease [Clostridiales Family XIII bacterium]
MGWNRRRVGEKTGGDRRGGVKLEMRHVPWVFAFPAIALALLLRYLPSLLGVSYSFTDWTGMSFSANPTGFSNYINIFSDVGTRGSVGHTLLIAALMVVFSNLFGLLLALILRRRLKLRNLYRALFFLPFALTRLATGYVWQYILSYDGPLNQFLGFIGLENLQRAWLADPRYAIYMVVLVLVWQYIGLALVIYLAGLEGIPEELDDAVAVDGASRWRRFYRVTLPLIAPAVTIAMTFTMIWGLSTFDQIFALTGGGPVDATQTLATMVWRTTFEFGKFGKGSAFAVILTVVVAIFSVLQNGLLRRREEAL